MSNEIAKREDRITTYLNRDDIQSYLRDVIGQNKDKFITNLVSATNQNKELQKCTSLSLMSGALTATTLNLSLNKSFGYVYLVPFKNKKLSDQKHVDVYEAQFQIGYRGYIQLALRTGQYKKINAIPVYKGQFESWNALTEEIALNEFDDFQNDEIIGYVAYFKLVNGFEKTIFWSMSKMQTHADKYSQAFSLEIAGKIKAGKIPQSEMWKYSSFWYKDFDEMALKTMLRQLLSKWGIMSEELQKAFEDDQTIINGDSKVYNDNLIEDDPLPKQQSLNDINSLPNQILEDKQEIETTIDIDFEEPQAEPTQQKTDYKSKLREELINRGLSLAEANMWLKDKTEFTVISYLEDPASIDTILEEIKGF